MKDYIVHNTDEPAYNEWFLVKAGDEKEAINKVYEVYGHEYRKKDYKAYNLSELYGNADVEGIVVIS